MLSSFSTPRQVRTELSFDELQLDECVQFLAFNVAMATYMTTCSSLFTCVRTYFSMKTKHQRVLIYNDYTENHFEIHSTSDIFGR
jgi:hypothetical protein